MIVGASVTLLALVAGGFGASWAVAATNGGTSTSTPTAAVVGLPPAPVFVDKCGTADDVVAAIPASQDGGYTSSTTILSQNPLMVAVYYAVTPGDSFSTAEAFIKYGNVASFENATQDLITFRYAFTNVSCPTQMVSVLAKAASVCTTGGEYSYTFINPNDVAVMVKSSGFDDNVRTETAIPAGETATVTSPLNKLYYETYVSGVQLKGSATNIGAGQLVCTVPPTPPVDTTPPVVTPPVVAPPVVATPVVPKVKVKPITEAVPKVVQTD